MDGVSKLKLYHKFADLFSKQGQECLVDNVISIGFCFLQAIPENVREKQEMLFKLIDGKECKWVLKCFKMKCVEYISAKI